MTFRAHRRRLGRQREVALVHSDLARAAADLVSLADDSASRSLNELVGLASRQLPSCSGAAAALWQDGEPAVQAASHPDVADLTDVGLLSGRSPELTALASGDTPHCPDTLAEERWPEYAHAALSRGVRSSVTMVYQSGAAAVTMSLFGARPRALDPAQLPLGELLVAVGGAVLSNLSKFRDARLTAWQFRDAAESRTLVDQAKGILMHAFGCSAGEALERMRAISQQRNIKVVDVAQRVLDSHHAQAG